MKSKKIEISTDDLKKKMTKASIKNLDKLKGGLVGFSDAAGFIVEDYGGL